jgi:ComF family protein
MTDALNWLRTNVSRTALAAGDLLFPPVCGLCGAEVPSGQPLFCAACRVDLWPRDKNYCPRCAMPYPDLPNPEGTCADCRDKKHAFDAARSLGIYQTALRDVVLRMKHRTYEPLAMQVGSLLAERIAAEPFSAPPELVAPVPMYWLKRLWRGTSAADSLAHSIANHLELPCIADLVRCRRWLQRQSRLAPSERADNVRGAYRVGWGFDLRGVRVLLVDDVITTGSTVNAIARELNRAGAAQVYVASVARAAWAT